MHPHVSELIHVVRDLVQQPKAERQAEEVDERDAVGSLRAAALGADQVPNIRLDEAAVEEGR
jgi:uncharacterized protein YbjQ (UPF0145 family)